MLPRIALHCLVLLCIAVLSIGLICLAVVSLALHCLSLPCGGCMQTATHAGVVHGFGLIYIAYVCIAMVRTASPCCVVLCLAPPSLLLPCILVEWAGEGERRHMIRQPVLVCITLHCLAVHCFALLGCVLHHLGLSSIVLLPPPWFLNLLVDRLAYLFAGRLVARRANRCFEASGLCVLPGLGANV